MSEFVEVKVSEMKGRVLDWAVQMSVWSAGGHLREDNEAALADGAIYVSRENKHSTDLARCEPLIELCCEMCRTAEGEWMAVVPHPSDGRLMICYDSSLLVAMCRAIVEAYLGGMVQVPSELVGIK